MLPDLSVVLGGAASGKSTFAEGLVAASGRDRVYLATARIHDEEMRTKVDRHRSLRGAGWHTVEAPLEVGPALAAVPRHSAVLLDCATMWLSNHLLAEHDLAGAEAGLFEGLAACPAPVVVVSNEVGLSVVPENALARRFREAQGRLNQRLASHADLVVNVVAGLPQVLKGTLP
ncbi:bifunctional adenosylcobinamide kinase/adenosylcobinamide-phosphate guanylyltransferase [Roseovarius salis]|uniref:bifunctional adenosylcobinamide kinase/adenosylcobinamide-phosphate guanylyltransferase n=1 Tax=Roseovarius salis TaxID=3376063 RepID=UPI0037C64904